MTAGTVQVGVPEGDDGRLYRLVAHYANVSSDVELTTASASLHASSPDGTRLTEYNTICKMISGLSREAHVLMGETTLQQAVIAEWLSYRHTKLTPLTEEGLKRVDDWLESRTFLVGNAITLADLVTFATLYRAVKYFPAAQIDRYCNLVRWFDYMQHVANSSGTYDIVAIKKPRFRLPAAQVVQSKADAAKPAAAPSKEIKIDQRLTPSSKATPAQSAAGPSPPAGSAEPPSAADTAAPKAAPTENLSAAKDKQGKPAEQQNGVPAAPPPVKEATVAGPSVDMLDLRVGRIADVRHHPNADSLYVEDIDMGEGKPRQVVSGLVKFVPIEKMKGRAVVVVANLKPAKMRDVMSYGMVLCASNASHDKVDPIDPPASAAVGEKVTFSGYDNAPEDVLNPKKKIFEKIAPDLQTDSIGVAVYKGVPFMTSAGPVTASIPNGIIS